MRFNELISGVRSDVAVKVYGEEFSEMQPIAQQIATILRSIEGAADIKVEQTEGLPVMNIDIDRDTISRLGLSVTDVQDVISIAVGGREAVGRAARSARSGRGRDARAADGRRARRRPSRR